MRRYGEAQYFVAPMLPPMSTARSKRCPGKISLTGLSSRGKTLRPGGGSTIPMPSFRGSRFVSPIADTRALCGSRVTRSSRKTRPGERWATAISRRKGEAAPGGGEIRNGALTLAEARRKAREWLNLISRGIDPKVEEERRRAESRRRQVNTFASVASDFLDRHASKLAKSAEAERIIKGEFVKHWGVRPI